jgi:hypothetical protein
MAFGGYTKGPRDESMFHREAYRFDASGNRWIRTSSLLSRRQSPQVVSIGSKVYLLLGICGMSEWRPCRDGEVFSSP